MKNLALAAIVALSAAPAAFAASNNQILSNPDLAEIRLVVPGADVSNLTTAQAGALAAVLHNDDAGDSKGAAIRSILGNPSVEASRAADLAAVTAYSSNTTKGSDER